MVDNEIDPQPRDERRELLEELSRASSALTGAVYLFCLPESDFTSGEIIVAAGGLWV